MAKKRDDKDSFVGSDQQSRPDEVQDVNVNVAHRDGDESTLELTVEDGTAQANVPPLVEATSTSDSLSITNISGMTLTIKSRGSLAFPSGTTEQVSRKEADLWVSKGWAVIQ